MTESAKIHIEGPQNNSGNYPDGQLDLYLVEDATFNAETEANLKSVQGNEDGEALLAGFEGSKELSYNGKLNGNRVMYAGFGNDPVEAFREYVYNLESLVLAQQGRGYKVVDDERGFTLEPDMNQFGVLIDEIEWTYEAGEGVTGDYRVSGKVSDGVQIADSRSDYLTAQSKRFDPNITNDKIVFDGTEVNISEVSERTYTRSVDFQTSNMIHQADVPVVGIAESGVEGEFIIQGTINKNQYLDFNIPMERLLNQLQGKQATFRDALTKREFTGLVSSTDTTLEAGNPNQFDVSLSLEIGQKITNL